MIVAYVSLGLIGFFVYRLGAIWFDRWIGAVAAAIVLTRAPFLSNGLRAYIDLPYIALCLGALLIEAKRPSAGWPVLALLALAGLLRPEAWLFAVVYWLYLASLAADRSDRSRAEARASRPLAALALAGPLLWALFDSITTGSPIYSWTGTKETVETLERQTGPVDLVLYGPRRLGEVLQWPGMVGALGGVVLGLAFLRRRSVLGVAAAALALGRLRPARLRRPRDPPPLHDARRRDPGDLRRRRPARLAAARARPPLAPPLAGLRRRSSWRCSSSGCRTSGTSTRGSTPTSPTRPGSRATSPTWSTPAPSSRSAARSPSPTTAPSPASPSASTSSRPRSSAPARKERPSAATSSPPPTSS